MYCGPLPQDNEPTLFERLRDTPKSFSDEELQMLMKMYEDRKPRGTNAKLPAMAYLEYERRHSPTGKKA